MWTAICPLSPAKEFLRTFAMVRGEGQGEGILSMLPSEEKPLIRPPATFSPYEGEKGHRRMVEPVELPHFTASEEYLTRWFGYDWASSAV